MKVKLNHITLSAALLTCSFIQLKSIASEKNYNKKASPLFSDRTKISEEHNQLLEFLFVGDFHGIAEYLHNGGDPSIRFSISNFKSIHWLDYIIENIFQDPKRASYTHHNPKELVNGFSFHYMGNYLKPVDFELLQEIIILYLQQYRDEERFLQALRLSNSLYKIAKFSLEQTVASILFESIEQITDNQSRLTVVEYLDQIKNSTLSEKIVSWITDNKELFKDPVIKVYLNECFGKSKINQNPFYQNSESSRLTPSNYFDNDDKLTEKLFEIVESWKETDNDLLFISLLHRTLFRGLNEKKHDSYGGGYYIEQTKKVEEFLADFKNYIIQASIQPKLVEEEAGFDILFMLGLAYSRTNTTMYGHASYEQRLNLSRTFQLNRRLTVFDVSHWDNISIDTRFKKEIRDLMIFSIKNGHGNIKAENSVFKFKNFTTLMQAGNHNKLLRYITRFAGSEQKSTASVQK